MCLSQMEIEKTRMNEGDKPEPQDCRLAMGWRRDRWLLKILCSDDAQKTSTSTRRSERSTFNPTLAERRRRWSTARRVR
ncbi:hypothetical protein EUGRSUZ_A02589 [Eucalyptus grandis]|uniref:Uncharacterized protein n=2 Tax=Eucalyptus grandis TaxID=71139 RepID=A0ACC3M827_EUCGR|nr:hypothetical protein EUGRSUZ_A02589 [Eucalyptus grandis]